MPAPAASATASSRVHSRPSPVERLARSRWPVVGFGVLVVAGAVLLNVAMAGVGPGWLDRAGAVLVATAYAWALAARTGGRAVVFGFLALVVALAAATWDAAVLRSGAAVLTAAVSAALGVLLTRPAVTFLRAVREVFLALLVAGIGGAAAVGFRPDVELDRFGYLTLALAFGLVLGLVHRLGAGFHGLGGRGLIMVLAGLVVIGLSLAYAELLRRYGADDLLASSREVLGQGRRWIVAVPQPMSALLGIPALVWGCHQRARRRQGWWACAFGVAATAPLCLQVVTPQLSLLEVVVSQFWSGVVGMLLAYVVIRADLYLTGPRGRRARRAEEAEAARAVRPEPPRTAPLL